MFIAGVGTNVPVSWLLVLVCSYRVLVVAWCWYERPCIEVATTLLVVRACCWCVVAGVGTNVPVSWLLVLAGCSYRVLVCGWCWYERPCIEVATTLLVVRACCWCVVFCFLGSENYCKLLYKTLYFIYFQTFINALFFRVAKW